MILRTATTLGLLAALSLATARPALAQPEAPAPTLQIQPNTPTPAEKTQPKVEAVEPAKTAEPPVVAVPARQEEPPIPAIPMPPVAPVVPAPVVPAPAIAPQTPPVEVAPAAPVEEEWHIAIVPLGGCYPPAPTESNAPDVRYYREVYEAIPFSRAEFEANPSYRHDSTMEILFGYLRPVRGQGQIGTSLYYPIQSPPVASSQPWFGYGNYFPGFTPWYRFGTRGYLNRSYFPFHP